MVKIVEENMTGVIGALGIGTRYYVIDTPINETGVCKEFAAREAAQRYIDWIEEQKKIKKRVML